MLLIRVLQGKRGCRVFRALSGWELAAELHSAQSGTHAPCVRIVVHAAQLWFKKRCAAAADDQLSAV